ncbi:MAG: NAD-dependent epimerase/dehydratase family protein, partial [Planctomycetaceae bacterium]|nr:NAD-dependent epimerase/dehydratase family protein [Planctomycetaceae bacterium]
MWPAAIDTVEQLDELQSRPGPAAIDSLRRTGGDIIVLGAAGKMGPALIRMLQRASAVAGSARRIIAVSRFSNSSTRAEFESLGVGTIAGDLADPGFVAGLPDAANVFFLGGMKFGATGNEPLTWGMNAWMPALVADRYAGRRIVAFSTGNVYGLAPVAGGGSKETDPLSPVGEYAMSCVARERLFQYFCEQHGTPTTLIRLNYAVEMRYGVLVDLAQRIVRDEPVDLAMGYVNVIWQGDACNAVIASLADCTVPASILNVAGLEILRIRDVALRLGDLLQRTPQFTGTESFDALLNNAER